MFKVSYIIIPHSANSIRKIIYFLKMKIQLIFLFCLLFWANFTFAQWEHIATIGNYELRTVKFFNENTGIVAGQGGIWRSTNGGVNWTPVLSGQNINDMSFSDIYTGYVVGDSGKVYNTTNNGSAWVLINTPTNQNLNGVSFTNFNIGYSVGKAGVVIKTTNSGNSWTIQNPSITDDLNGIFMINATTGFFYGSFDKELFANTINGGFNWIYTLGSAGNIIKSACYIPLGNNFVLAVGTNGRIRRSTDNGYNWTITTNVTNQILNDVVFIDPNTGYIIGNAGTLLKSTNSGLNWFTETSNTSNNLNGINFINGNTGWIVGANGIIMRKGIPVSINYSNNIIPKADELFQNYPNPFNPITTIGFQLDKNSFVKITLYNINGQFLKTLLSANLNVGEYEIDFYGDGLTSGVYFYKLETETSIQIKEMIFIK